MPRRWRDRGSVRTRTTVLTTVVSGAALTLGALLLIATLDRSLHATEDDLARGRAGDLARVVALGALSRDLTGIDPDGVGQVFTADGRVLASSPNIVGRPPITGRASTSRLSTRLLRNAPDDNQTENYRVWVTRATGPDGPATVVVGSSLESVSEASRTLRRDLTVGLPVLVLLVAAGTWLVVGRTLRPVEDIRAQVAAISEEDLDRRVPVPPSGDEVGRLAVTMNQMLARLQDSSRRQRAFVADASHELQSPIAAIRTQLEVALSHDDNDWPGTARLLLADADAMEGLVRDLLFLARTHETGLPLRAELLDLDDLVLEEVTRLRARTTTVLDTRRVSAAPVHGDADELRRLVRNVLENAVRHARTAVRLCLGSDHDGARLDVLDDGPGVSGPDREHVFDRFWTADSARSRSGHPGSGLGLAIARQVARRHGGSLELGDSVGGHFVLRLPPP